MKKMQISYFDLSPGIDNPFLNETHSILFSSLNTHFPPEHKLYEKIGGFNLAFMICTKQGTQNLTVKGPGKSKKYQVIEYSIFIPDQMSDLNQYIEWVISGVSDVILKYGNFKDELAQIESDCKQALGLF